MFELAHSPYADGYGEALLSIGECKAHLRVTHDAEDDLIRALRDAAIEYVERFCSVKLGPVTGMVWSAEGWPGCPSARISLGVWPVSAITAVRWRDADGATVDGVPGDYRVSGKGELRLASSGLAWPTNSYGPVDVTFDAGYAEGSAPSALLVAVRLMLGHLYMNREAVVNSGASGEVPLGVSSICALFRPVMI